MVSRLQPLNLILDARLVSRLEQESERRGVSVSELGGTLLARELGLAHQPVEAVERIRRLRAAVGPMPDSARIVRWDRDRRW